MMRSPTSESERAAGDAAGHLTDADLVRHLDGEPARLEAHDVAAHLRHCAACAARADLLHERRRRLARLLADTDVEVPPAPAAEALLARAARRTRPTARPALRAAALLLVAGALAAQPSVRRWVGQQWRRAASPAPGPAAAVPRVGQEGGGAGTAVAFEPGPGPFTIQFDARPTAGTLTIAGAEGTRASAERLSGANPDLLVMPHGLHVRNGSGASGGAASYLVRVPRSVQRVYLRFGAAAPSADLVVDLGREARRVIQFDRR